MMIDFESLWNQPLFSLVKDFVLNTGQFESMTKQEKASWYITKAPKAQNPLVLEENLDARGINLSKMALNKIWLDYLLDQGDLSNASFEGVLFSGGSAFHSNFNNSVFKNTQMCPFYAHDADFSGCTFDTCLAFGNSPIKEPYGNYNDFTKCNFSNVSANNSSFNVCDFTMADFSNSRFIGCEMYNSLFNGANLTKAYFESCIFLGGSPDSSNNQCDFRGCNLDEVKFVACDFLHAKFDDTPEVRAVVASGNNINCDSIVWFNPQG